MAAPPETIFRQGEFHKFEAAGHTFVYTVPAGGIFAPDAPALDALELLGSTAMPAGELLSALQDRGYDRQTATDAITEMFQARLIRDQHGFNDAPQEPVENFPLQSLVLNLTNQCNLACQYCYEFGEDKLATPDGKPKFMDHDVARASVDHLLESSQGRRAVHITFFGGETLMNFPLLKWVVNYASTRAAEVGKSIDYSLTTNGTLLSPEIIEFLAEEKIGVTVSIDGPKEMHDALRVYSNGRGSYDVMAPKVKQLLARHKTRPIAARVTLTDRVTDVRTIFRHLREEMGFSEVGFAPVTASAERLYSIGNNNMDKILGQFRDLAFEYRDAAIAGRAHGFSNVSDTLAELHAGINKSHPCGAGLGLVGVGPSGDIAPCHRFVDSDEHAMGNVMNGGLDRAKQQEFLSKGHVSAKYECQSCWARPLCAGGCHHEAFVRFGDTGHPNLHFCDWIRGWTDLCLQIYGEIAARNPSFLTFFENRKVLA
ncbi:MAG: quinohemoprotein amine dehydrogenase maturation protein [Bryobacteraceae bacterium]|nr:quinohemoprotein amine dehydrogenase maturation protein [Bryobacteraceae bacterium]